MIGYFLTLGKDEASSSIWLFSSLIMGISFLLMSLHAWIQVRKLKKNGEAKEAKKETKLFWACLAIAICGLLLGVVAGLVLHFLLVLLFAIGVIQESTRRIP